MLNSNELINKVKNYNKFLNPEKLDKAYNFAVKAHKSQKRASGDPYSVHPIEVANILTELKLDSATITTGLLHDTIEDTFATYETIKQEFGDEVAVSSGFKTKKDRSKESMKLHMWGFTNFDTIRISQNKESISEFDVWLGKQNKVNGYVKDDIFKTIKKGRKKELKVIVEYEGPIKAPIYKDQEIGLLKIFYKDELIGEHKIFSTKDVKKVNLFSRIAKSVNYLIWGDV